MPNVKETLLKSLISKPVAEAKKRKKKEEMPPPPQKQDIHCEKRSYSDPRNVWLVFF